MRSAEECRTSQHRGFSTRRLGAFFVYNGYMSLKRNLLLLTGAVILLAVSIKYFPYHCNCTAKNANLTAATTTLPITTRTPGVRMGMPEVKLGSTTIQVDISDTEALREQGLSGKTSLAENEGMLFVFPTPGPYGFWMKDMNFPLDIVWINEEKQVIGIERNLSPGTYPQTFYPLSAVKYVLELTAGFSDAHGIKVGTVFSQLL
jgi:uncharacterized protein